MHASELPIESHESAAARRARAVRAPLKSKGISLLFAAGCLALGACATPPLVPYSADTPPLALVPASQAQVRDERGRFRDIYCSVLEARGQDVPDHRSCEDALTRVGSEPARTGRPVDLGNAIVRGRPCASSVRRSITARSSTSEAGTSKRVRVSCHGARGTRGAAGRAAVIR